MKRYILYGLLAGFLWYGAEMPVQAQVVYTYNPGIYYPTPTYSYYYSPGVVQSGYFTTNSYAAPYPYGWRSSYGPTVYPYAYSNYYFPYTYNYRWNRGWRR